MNEYVQKSYPDNKALRAVFFPFIGIFRERRITMSLFIHALIVILLVLLAAGIGLLIFVCWALAVCADRRDHYPQKDYRVK